MTGIDTNLLVRYITRDDAEQYRRARAFLETDCTQSEPGFVNAVVLCEVVWVLKAAYAASKDEQAQVLERLLDTRQLRIAHRDAVVQAVRDFKAGTADFADCLIGRLNQEARCPVTATFDERASRLDSFRLI